LIGTISWEQKQKSSANYDPINWIIISGNKISLDINTGKDQIVKIKNIYNPNLAGPTNNFKL